MQKKFEEQEEVQEEDQEKKIRVKLPEKNQLIGVIEQKLGGNKIKVECSDKISRICRIPGRLKRKLWLKVGDIVLVEKWELDENKADIIFKYSQSHINWLKNNNYLEKLNGIF